MNNILLEKIAQEQKAKCKTDKLGHGYLPIYDKIFSSQRNETQKVLEIGIHSGGSLRLWKEYFTNATIFGLDNNRNTLSKVKDDDIICYFGDQSNRNFLSSMMQEIGKVDIIIDDGSHRMDHQQISLGFLFQFVKNGGYYIIEDLHTSFGLSGNYAINEDRSNTTYWFLKNVQFNLKSLVSSMIMTEEENKYFLNHVDSCSIYEIRHKITHRQKTIRRRRIARRRNEVSITSIIKKKDEDLSEIKDEIRQFKQI